MNRAELSKKIAGAMLCALFLTIIHFAVMQCNADDAQGYNWIYKRYELGIEAKSDSILNPMLLILSALHFFGIGSNGAELCLYYFAFWYFLCVWLMLYLAIRSAKDNKWWLLLMAVFILIPSINTNRYHLIPTFVSLLVILLVSAFFETRKKRYLYAGGGICTIHIGVCE